MEYKTYIQKPPTVEAYYDESGESEVTKELFENSWREVTEVEQVQLADTGYINALS